MHASTLIATIATGEKVNLYVRNLHGWRMHYWGILAVSKHRWGRSWPFCARNYS